MQKRNILIFIDWYLPGYKAGGPIQSVSNMIAHLDDFNYFVVTRDTDYCEKDVYPGIKSNEWNILSNGTNVFYFSDDQLNFKNIKNIIQHTKYDFIYLNGIFSVYFTLMPLFYLRKAGSGKNVIVAARGMFAQGALSIKKRKKSLFLLTARFLGLFKGVIFHATNNQEHSDIKAVFKNAEIKIAENLPQKNTESNLHQRVKTEGELKIISVARISPEKNLVYALKALKNIQHDITFDVFGPVYNEAYWLECKQVIADLPPNIKVNYNGSIEAALVLNKLKESHIMFMPTLGENFGHIILQSLMAGCPVLISDRTPWRNLEAKKTGFDINLNDENGFIKALNFFATMPQADFNLWSEQSFLYAKAVTEDKETIAKNKKLFPADE